MNARINRHHKWIMHQRANGVERVKGENGWKAREVQAAGMGEAPGPARARRTHAARNPGARYIFRSRIAPWRNRSAASGRRCKRLISFDPRPENFFPLVTVEPFMTDKPIGQHLINS